MIAQHIHLRFVEPLLVQNRARQEGADGEVRVDDCCCAGSMAVSPELSPASGSEVPLVRL